MNEHETNLLLCKAQLSLLSWFAATLKNELTPSANDFLLEERERLKKLENSFQERVKRERENGQPLVQSELFNATAGTGVSE